jgi:hypothetical protein
VNGAGEEERYGNWYPDGEETGVRSLLFWRVRGYGDWRNPFRVQRFVDGQPRVGALFFGIGELEMVEPFVDW